MPRQNPMNNFQKKIGDTPTDALQLVNKKYVDDNAGVSFGYVSGSSGNPSTPFPAGWSSSRTGTGTYTVTHNLGSTNYIALVNPVGSGGGATPVSFSANSFDVFTFNTLTGSGTNLDFVFILA